MAYRLFTTYWNEQNEGRRAEIDACLDMNIAAFDLVTVLAQEDTERPDWFDGEWFRLASRQTFSDFMVFAVASQPGDVVVLANSDIIVPQLAIEQMSMCLQENEAYCLSRWDFVPSVGCRLFDKAWSQDAWAFRVPPKRDIGGEYFFGVPGVDNRFAAELDAAGYKVLNPSRDIRTYHLHLSGHRTSNRPENRVPLPYLFVSPHKIGEQPTYKRPVKASKRASQFQV